MGNEANLWDIPLLSAIKHDGTIQRGRQWIETHFEFNPVAYIMAERLPPNGRVQQPMH